MTELMEFYNLSDLLNFQRFCEEKQYPLEEALGHLREMTITDYLACQQEPDIMLYMPLIESYYRPR